MTVTGVFAQEKYQIDGFTSKDIRYCVQTELNLTKDEYGVYQAYYDVRKLREHGIVEKEKGRNRYKLTEFGVLFVKTFLTLDKYVIGPVISGLNAAVSKAKKNAADVVYNKVFDATLTL